MPSTTFPVPIKVEEEKSIRLICRPEKLEPPHKGPIRMPISKALKTSGTRTTGKAGPKNEELEIAGVWLNPGLNSVTPTEMGYIKDSIWYDNFIEMGVVTILDPLPLDEGALPTDTTLDYSSKDALEIIRACDDIEWLRSCNAKETGKERINVKRAIAARIKELSKREQELSEARKG